MKQKKTITGAILKSKTSPRSNMVYEYKGFLKDQIVEVKKSLVGKETDVEPGDKVKISRFFLKSSQQTEKYKKDLNPKTGKPYLYLAIAFTSHDHAVYIPITYLKPL